MNEREELMALRRMAELEAKASGVQPIASNVQSAQPRASFTGPGAIGIQDVIFGDKTLAEFGKNKVEAFKNIPENVSEEMSRPWPKPGTPGQPIDTNQAIELAMNVMPVTRLTGATRQAILKPAKSAAEVAREKVLQQAGEAGYSVPRSNIKQSFLTNLGERFGGKQAIEATAQAKNQPITNKLAAKALGLRDDAVITPEVLTGIRSEAGKAYEVLKNVGDLKADKQYMEALKDISKKYSGASKDFPELSKPEVQNLIRALGKSKISSEGAIEQIKNLRATASDLFRKGESGMGRAYRESADALEDLMERNIEPKFGKKALDSYREARKLIAKTHTVEDALSGTGGNVDASQLAKMLDKGKPLSDELRKIAEFASNFPKLSRVPQGAPPSGGLFEPLVYSTAGGAVTGLQSDNPWGVAAGLIPIVGKPLARSMMTKVPKVASQKTQKELMNDFLLSRLLLGGEQAIDNGNKQQKMAQMLRAGGN